MKLTNASKGTLALWIGGDAIEIQPGDSTRELTAEEVSNLKAHPIVGDWIATGKLTGAGDAPAASPIAVTEEAPKPKKSKRVAVEG